MKTNSLKIRRTITAQYLLTGCIWGCGISLVMLLLFLLMGRTITDIPDYYMEVIVLILFNLGVCVLTAYLIGSAKSKACQRNIWNLERETGDPLDPEPFQELAGSGTIFVSDHWLAWHSGTNFRFWNLRWIAALEPVGTMTKGNLKAICAVQPKEGKGYPFRIIYNRQPDHDLYQEFQAWQQAKGMTETAAVKPAEAGSRTCAVCGGALKPTDQFCGNCGAPVSEPAAAPVSQLFCPHCGRPVSAGTSFCGFCGAAITPSASRQSKARISQYGTGSTARSSGRVSPAFWAALVVIIVILLTLLFLIIGGSRHTTPQDPFFGGNSEKLAISAVQRT